MAKIVLTKTEKVFVFVLVTIRFKVGVSIIHLFEMVIVWCYEAGVASHRWKYKFVFADRLRVISPTLSGILKILDIWNSHSIHQQPNYCSYTLHSHWLSWAPSSVYPYQHICTSPSVRPLSFTHPCVANPLWVRTYTCRLLLGTPVNAPYSAQQTIVSAVYMEICQLRSGQTLVTAQKASGSRNAEE